METVHVLHGLSVFDKTKNATTVSSSCLLPPEVPRLEPIEVNDSGRVRGDLPPKNDYSEWHQIRKSCPAVVSVHKVICQLTDYSKTRCQESTPYTTAQFTSHTLLQLSTCQAPSCPPPRHPFLLFYDKTHCHGCSPPKALCGQSGPSVSLLYYTYDFPPYMKLLITSILDILLIQLSPSPCHSLTPKL